MNQNSEILFSIIVPVFNSSQAIGVLVESIPARKDIELIFVDDYSDIQEYNKTSEILLEHKSRFGDLLILKNNLKKSAGSARNVGLEKAKGRWILFADSDDYFTGNLSQQLDTHVDSVADLIVFEPVGYDLDNQRDGHSYFYYVYMMAKYFENPTEVNRLRLGYGFVVPWSKMIKRSCIDRHQILFDEVIAANDVMFSAKVFFHSEHTIFKRENIYCYVDRSNALTTKKSVKNVETRVDVNIQKNLWLKQHYPRDVFDKIKGHQIHMLFTSLFGYGFGFAYKMFRKMQAGGITFLKIPILIESFQRYFAKK